MAMETESLENTDMVHPPEKFFIQMHLLIMNQSALRLLGKKLQPRVWTRRAAVFDHPVNSY